MNSWVFIVNPVAGAGRLKKRWPAMQKALQAAGILFEVRITQGPNTASTLVRDLIRNGHRNFVGVGGDGTNNEIINGIYNQKIVAPEKIYYTLLPFGTGNDWVRTHQIPSQLSKWIGMLKEGHSIMHDLGWVDYFPVSNQSEELPEKKRRYFANVAGLAYDAHIVKVAETFPYRRKSKLLYLWLVVRELFGFQPPLLKLSFNNTVREQFFYTINIGICKYSGGGMQLVAHANPQSEKLALTLIRKFPKWRVILDTPKLFSGKLDRHRFTSILHTTHLKVEAQHAQSLSVETDGEYLGTGPLEFGILPKAIRIIVPA